MRRRTKALRVDEAFKTLASRDENDGHIYRLTSVANRSFFYDKLANLLNASSTADVDRDLLCPELQSRYASPSEIVGQNRETKTCGNGRLPGVS